MMINMKLMLVFFSLLFALFMQYGCVSSDFNQSSEHDDDKMIQSLPNQHNLRLFFTIAGNLQYGYFYAILHVGSPPHAAKPYYLDLDTGSDLTWIQCDGPHVKRAPHHAYKPHDNFISKNDPNCHHSNNQLQRDRCDFTVRYVDGGSCRGSMVRDIFTLRTTPTTVFTPSIVFGCGHFEKPGEQVLKTDGVLGLGKSRISFPAQLKALGLITHNFHGHCLSRQTRGYGFFGQGARSLSPNVVTWLQMQHKPHYAVGPAVLSLDGMLPQINVQSINLDTGSTYTYFRSPIYRALHTVIQESLRNAPLRLAPEDHSLPVCWKDHRPINNINEVKPYFKPIKLDFAGNKIILLEAEDYLIISQSHNVCLGILDAETENMNENILGDISMLDKLVIYDNDRGVIGWVPTLCQRNSDESVNDTIPDPGFATMSSDGASSSI